jgi:hypothetical protein
MLQRTRLVSSFLALGSIAVLAGRCEAQSYRDAEKHFTVELPKGWEVMSKSEMAQVNSLIGGRMMGMGVHYDAGLRHKSARLGSLPYVLIQVMRGPPSGASYEELEKSLSIDLKGPIKEAQGRMGDIVREMKVGQPVLDRKSLCVVMRTESSVANVGVVKGVSMGHLGKDNIVFIHCYAKAEEFDSSVPTFTHINEWFSFDRGYDFKPGKGSIGLFSWTGNAGHGGVIGGAVGLMVGVAGFLFRLLAKSGTGGASRSSGGTTGIDPMQNRDTTDLDNRVSQLINE